MGWNDEYMIKFFMTPEGSKAFGVSWGYIVRHHDQTALEFTQNFTRASRFRDQDAAQRCVDDIRQENENFPLLISKFEFMPVRE